MMGMNIPVKIYRQRKRCIAGIYLNESFTCSKNDGYYIWKMLSSFFNNFTELSPMN